MKYKTIGAFKNVQNVPYCKAASDMKVGMGVILDRVAKTATLPASEDDAKKVVYIVTNINDKPELLLAWRLRICWCLVLTVRSLRQQVQMAMLFASR